MASLRSSILIWLIMGIFTPIPSTLAICEDDVMFNKHKRYTIDDQNRLVERPVSDDSGATGSDQAPVMGSATDNGSIRRPVSAADYHQMLKQHWLAYYQTTMLQGLNMRTTPAPGTRRIPKSIRDQFSKIKDEEGDPLQEFDNTTADQASQARNIAETSRRSLSRAVSNGWSMSDRAKVVKKVITASQNTPDRRFPDDPLRTYFSFNDIRAADISNAEMFVSARRDNNNVPHPVYLHVHVYKFTNDMDLLAEPVFSKIFKHGSDSDLWMLIDVTELVRTWVKYPITNYGLMVKAEWRNEEVSSASRDSTVATFDAVNRTTNIVMFVELTDGPTRARPMYEEPVCSPEHPNENCCRYPLVVDFESFGWDWIIAPKRYKAFYCAGACPLHYKQATHHAHLTQQLHQQNQSRGIGPCCTPQDYADLKIISTTDTGVVIERKIPGAVVTRCGCA